MAQQTQISRVVETWARFLDRFPTVAALAASTPADVLRAWRGMGYDRRALNLRRTAQAILTDHGGSVPTDVAALERLPGIGPYTARAVASIAFGRRVGAVDTNVRRVLGRSLAADATPSPAWLQAVADASVDPGRPADWTHAVMDIGATLCRPREPRCAECPLRPWCRTVAGLSAGVAPDEAASGTSAQSRPATVTASRARASAIPFRATTRWLRGRIVDRLRGADGSDWTEISGPFGDHDDTAVVGALAALARDHVIERDPERPAFARLPTDAEIT